MEKSSYFIKDVTQTALDIALLWIKDIKCNCDVEIGEIFGKMT